jgi:hypothetical protein
LSRRWNQRFVRRLASPTVDAELLRTSPVSDIDCRHQPAAAIAIADRRCNQI